MINVRFNPFHKIGKCFGLTVWSWSRRVELWVCFSSVRAHRHPGQDVEVVPLFGQAYFYRVTDHQRSIKINRRNWFRAFSIPAGAKHWFKLVKRPLIFLNITTGKSAADNFVHA